MDFQILLETGVISPEPQRSRNTQLNVYIFKFILFIILYIVMWEHVICLHISSIDNLQKNHCPFLLADTSHIKHYVQIKYIKVIIFPS